jgi:hypothetical protein
MLAPGVVAKRLLRRPLRGPRDDMQGDCGAGRAGLSSQAVQKVRTENVATG